MGSDTQNQVFMKERLEKRTICKMITMGLVYSIIDIQRN